MDVERTLGILNAITAGLLRVIELIVPLLITFIFGVSKALLVAFDSSNAYRKTRSKETLLTHIDKL